MHPRVDLAALSALSPSSNRYERRVATLLREGKEVACIESTVEAASANVRENLSSFVIYGEPQSGKTEMMIALTARLLDDGVQIVVVLLNDSVQLLRQNLHRFQRSGLSPSPKKFSELLPDEVIIGSQPWIVFCKKNAKDLAKLLQKLKGHSNRAIIDDEADFATPNTKVNQKEKSRINELTGELIGHHGRYIGVIATPGRLDLNRTHDNLQECWIDFPPHSQYTGQDVFFPVELSHLPYNLTFLPDSGDDPRHLREALFRFLVNVGHLNTAINDREENYSMLVHTSSKKADHSVDYKQIVSVFRVLSDNSHKQHETYIRRLAEIADERFPGSAPQICTYIMSNRERNNIVVMNSDKEVNAADNETATDPTTPFTIAIGGNIVSRGVTFNNLLSMFFTRDVKHKMQQDTYIQRARMFGSRQRYLRYFELSIPKALFLDWQKCFIFHRLSLASRKQNDASPVWLDGDRVTAVAAGSIDKTNVQIDRGEMSFALFSYNAEQVESVLQNNLSNVARLKCLNKLLGQDALPAYLIDYIVSFMPNGESALAIHKPTSIQGYVDRAGAMDKRTIRRAKGFIGSTQLAKFPDAIHHVVPLYNEEGMARVFYKYQGQIRFLKAIPNAQGK